MRRDALKRISMPYWLPLLVLMACPGFVLAQEPSVEAVRETFNRVEKMKEQITLPGESDSEVADQARKDAIKVQSKAFQQKIQAEKQRILETQFRPYLPELPKVPSAKSNQDMCPDRLPASERIFIFVSASMPMQTLRAYARDLDRLGDQNIVMVLRGFVDGMRYFQPTLDFLGKVLVKETGCRLNSSKPCESYQANIQIDPLVFHKLDISQVPAVAYVQSIQMVDAGQSMGRSGNLVAEPDAVVVYGDAALTYALQQIAEATHSPGIQKLIHALRGDFYDEQD